MKAQMIFGKMKSKLGVAAIDMGESVTDVGLMISLVGEAQTALA